MKHMIESITGNFTPSASVVDGSLIISLPNAVSPVVWRLDLGQARASALEVREKDNLFTLLLKTPRGDVNDIASFDTKAKAVAALMAVSDAMRHAHGQMKAAANDTPTPVYAGGSNLPVPVRTAGGGKPPRGKGGILAPIAALALIAILLTVIMNMAPAPTAALPGGGASTMSGTASPSAETGVPLSADDFLRGR